MLSLKDITKLSKKSVQNDLGVFLVEGKKSVHEALAVRSRVQQLLATQTFLKNNWPFLSEHTLTRDSFVIISDHNAQRITSTTTPEGVFAVVSQQPASIAELSKLPVIAVFDTIKDPGNLGTMLRTADWFGIKGIITTKTGTSVYNDKVIRSAMGSLFHLKMYDTPRLALDLQELKAAGFTIVVSTPQAQPRIKSLTSLPANTKICLVVGNESVGVSSNVLANADYTYTIPGSGQAESLNAAVSFGLMLYDWYKAQ